MRNLFRSRRPSAPAAPVVPLGERQEAELRAVARGLVRPGFVELDHVVVVLEDHELDDADPRARAEAARRIAREEWDRRAAEVGAARDGGDHERLAAAFAVLETRGVVARMAFGCCQTCGTDEIRDERGGDEWGFTFFHQQDAERLADPDATLFLGFGSFRERSEDFEVGRAVRDTLVSVGLPVTWDDDPGERIRVAIADWRKPLPAG